MSEEKQSYRQIMKATSIFGGVQVFNIIIGIIRSKVIAVLLGPFGMGIAGLLQSTLAFMTSLTSFGLATSAVKDVANAHYSGDDYQIATTISIFRKWVWATGLLGTFLTLALSPWISSLTFGNINYTWAFALLSITLLLGQLNSGQSVLLQGMRQHKFLASSSIIGSVLGLLITLPLYYFFKIKGIVPAIILTSVASLGISWYFVQKLKLPIVSVSKTQTITQGKDMLKMGFSLSLSSLITLGVAYIVRLYIREKAGIEEVGLYTAGFTFVMSYVGVVFSAMGTDYYPRLSMVTHNEKQRTALINQQAEIALLILAPIILVFLVFINEVVVLLYSTQFLKINDMILFAAVGMIFRAASWAIAYLFLATRENKLFLWNELLANIYMLVFNILGYKLYGLTGLGISFLLMYFIYLIQVYTIVHFKYQFRFSIEFYRIFGLQIFITLVTFLIVKESSPFFSYIFGSLLIIIMSLHSYRELDKRLDLKEIFLKILNR